MSGWVERPLPEGWTPDRILSQPFSQLNRTDFDTLIEWTEHEGWNPGRYDREAFWAQDPEGYRGLHVDGELIAGGSIVSYDGAFGFMGFFIVRPEYRGFGIGRHLWVQRRDALLVRLNDGAAIGMDGVVDMQPFYVKGGFTRQFADIRHTRQGAAMEVDVRVQRGVGDRASLHAYDKTCFCFDRPRFLDAWTNQPGGTVFRFVEGGRIRGWVALRIAASGRRIGPLFADNSEAADALYRACLDAAPGEDIHLDVPMNNAAAVALMERHGAEPQFECARMVHGPVPDWPIARIYGVTSYELG